MHSPNYMKHYMNRHVVRPLREASNVTTYVTNTRLEPPKNTPLFYSVHASKARHAQHITIDRWFIFIVATNCIKGCVGFVNPQPWQPWVPWHPKPYVPRQVGAPFLPPVNQVAGPVFNPLISAQRPPHFYPWHMPWAVPQYGLSPNVPQVNPPQAVSWRPGQFPYYSKPSQYYSNYGQMQPNPVFQQSRFPFQGSLMPAAKQAVLPVRTIQRNPAFLPKYQGIKGNPFAYKPQSRLFDLNNNYGGSQHPNQPVKGRQQLQEPLQFFGR